jgi:hypothetical protein
MLAGTSCSTPLRVTQPARSPPPGRLLLPKTPRKPLIDHPELVAVACPDCRCSPVEVLMIHSQRRFFVVSTVSRHLGCQSLAIPHRSEARCNRARVPSHASSALVMVAVPQHRHLVCRRDCSFHVSPLEAFSSQEFTASVIRQAGDLRMLRRFRATGSRGHAAGRMSTYRRNLRLVCVVLTDGMSLGTATNWTGSLPSLWPRAAHVSLTACGSWRPGGVMAQPDLRRNALAAGSPVEVARRAPTPRCPTCGCPADEVHYIMPWGTRTRLLMCRGLACGEVAAVAEPRWRKAPR